MCIRDSKIISGSSGADYSYETLLIAVGVVTSFFGIPGLETYTYGIKNAHEIHRLKQRLFIDIAEKGVLDKNYVIVGAGPTGVELSAALGTYTVSYTHLDVYKRQVLEWRVK